MNTLDDWVHKRPRKSNLRIEDENEDNLEAMVEDLFQTSDEEENSYDSKKLKTFSKYDQPSIIKQSKQKIIFFIRSIINQLWFI
jgi:hypothetical protein